MQYIPVPTEPSNIVAGDVDGDGTTDLVLNLSGVILEILEPVILSLPLAAKVIGPSLHQFDDHRKQMVPGLNSDSCTSDVANDVANNDVDSGSRRPEINRRHGAKLWRAFFVRHPLPFRFRHSYICFRRLHRRFVNPFEKG